MEHIRIYRSLLKGLTRSTHPRKPNKVLALRIRNLVDNNCEPKNTQVLQDLRHAALFLKHQHEHKLLLERYNPLIDLTAEERIHKTARRVGLDMPITHKEETK